MSSRLAVTDRQVVPNILTRLFRFSASQTHGSYPKRVSTPYERAFRPTLTKMDHLSKIYLGNHCKIIFCICCFTGCINVHHQYSTKCDNQIPTLRRIQVTPNYQRAFSFRAFLTFIRLQS